MKVIDSLFAFIADFMDKHRVKTTTVTAQTGSTGAATLAGTIPITATILSVDCNSNAYLAVPWIYQSGSGSKAWYAKIVSWQNWNVAGNVSVTLTIRYIEGGV